MKLRSIFLSALIATPVLGIAADKEVEDLLSKMRKAYSSVASARILVTTLLATEVGEMEIKVDTSYVKTNKIFAKVTGLPEAGSNGIIWKSDGKNILQQTPAGPKKVKFTIEEAERGLPVNLEVINLWDWKRQLSTAEGGNMKNSTFKLLKKETWKDKDYMVLEESAPRQNVFVRYFIDPKTYFIARTRVETLDKRDMIMDCKVTKMELNAKIDPKVFNIGAGVKI